MPKKNDRTKELFTGSRVCLAPMAGYSDAPFRLICSSFGADFCVTEMMSADGLVRGGGKTRGLLARMEGEGPLGAQLFGADPDTMAQAAVLAAAPDRQSRSAREAALSGPAFIDLNFGCPVKKVVRKNGGVAIMRDLDLMEKICRAVVAAVDIPVTAKIRSGWSRDEENYIEAGQVIEGSGAAAVILHPRYRTQGFGGESNREHLSRLREAVKIPVIASGDVKSPDDYFKLVEETGCSVVMIGRGAFGRPWIFREIKDRLAGREPADMPLMSRLDLFERLLDLEIEWYGERPGILELRKFYRWYFRGHSGMREYRQRFTAADSRAEVVFILKELREEIEKVWMKSE